MASDTSKTPGTRYQDLTRIFVYGSLKQGYALHFLLADQHFIGEARTAAEYRLLDRGTYPVLVKVEDSGQAVKGELYDVDVDCVCQLDEAEGVSVGLYKRDTIVLQPPHQHLAVQAYFYLRSTSGLRDCGQQWPSDV